MTEKHDLHQMMGELAALRERLDRQEAEFHHLRRQAALAGPPTASGPSALADGGASLGHALASRRGVLTGGAAVLAALGLAGAPATSRVARADQLAAAIFFIPPTRVVDTRASGSGIVTTGFDGTTGLQITPSPLTGGATRRFLINGKSFAQGNATFTAPVDISGVLCNLTTVGGPGGGFVTLFPGNIADANRPLASTLNPVTSPAFNFAACAISPTGTAPSIGTVAVFSTLTVDVIIDVVGYFF